MATEQMDKMEKIKKLYENIYNMVDTLHDETLVDPNQSPNCNDIIHIYSDGNITNQKGGWAYLQRNERNVKEPISKNLNLDVDKFKKILKNEPNVQCGYIIVTRTNAMLIREKMLALAELL